MYSGRDRLVEGYWWPDGTQKRCSNILAVIPTTLGSIWPS